jgi:hypothetical protein
MSDHAGKVIALDIDGVVMDYCSGIMSWAAKRGVRLGCLPNEVATFSMQSAFPEMSEPDIFAMIQEFNSTEEFGRLKPFQNAVETINSINRQYVGVTFWAITSAGSDEFTKELRRRNLTGLPFSEIHILPLGASKSEYLARLPAASIYVDDLKKHVDAAEALGHSGVLYRQSYNTADDHDRVAADWIEVGAHLRAHLES